MTEGLPPQDVLSEQPPYGPPHAVGSPPAPRSRRWVQWAVPAGTLLLGLAVGAGIGAAAASSDPTHSKQYQSLQSQASDAQAAASAAQASIATVQGEAMQSQAAAQSAQAAAAASASDVAAQAAAVQASAAALSASQAAVDANSIGEGTYTVGADVQPGTYKVSAPVTGQCYWEITKSGSNGEAIVQNDIVTGGYPTVRLSVGQDFKNQGCGTFVKQ